MRVGWILAFLCTTVLGQSLSSARIDLVEELEQLAKWCTKKKLIGSRNHVFELILRFDADHETARKWLRYTKRDGKWVRLKEYREPKNYDRDALPAFRRRKQEIAERFRSRLLGLSRRLRIDRERGDEHECINELLTAGSGERSDHGSTFEVDEP